MSDKSKPLTPAELEVYLDELMSPSEREVCAARLRDDPESAAQVELQTQIDASLLSTFKVRSPSAESVEALLAGQPRPERVAPQLRQTRTMRLNRRRLIWVAVAASIAWAIVAWQMVNRRRDQPFFEARSLVAIYRETIASGFEPYYECREADRFAATFAQRQGQPLRLAEMPPGSRMLGLSYAGGFSRDTTAMLCRVDAQPVMVFIDRAAADQPDITRSDVGVHVFRSERHELVFYEVTPFDQPRVVEYLLPSEPKRLPE